MRIEHSSFLDAPPDQSIDHRYLSAAAIELLPPGVFYKKKSELTRHRFIRFELVRGSRRVLGECCDDRGSWRSIPSELYRMADALGLPSAATETQALAVLGLSGRLLLSGAPLPAGEVIPPATQDQMQRLYDNYTDMVAQGHFDPDSPDLDRLQIVTSWIAQGSRVLDMGCNSGGFAPPLLERDCEVHGVDLSADLVAAAIRRGVLAVQAWAEDTPYASAHFDVVICAELLEHVLDPGVVLREAHRVLKPGGLLVGSVPHGAGPWGHCDMGHHPEHLRAFEPGELIALLERNAFRALSMQTLSHNSDEPIGIAFRAGKQ